MANTAREPGTAVTVSRLASFAVIGLILVLMAILFFRIVGSFLLPMFLAVVLVVVFRPLHRRMRSICRGRDRLAAGITTAAILLSVLLPLLCLVFLAASEAKSIGANFGDADEKEAAAETESRPDGQTAPPEGPSFVAKLADSLSDLAARAGVAVARDDVERTIQQKLGEWVGPAVRTTARMAGGLLIGLIVAIVSLYFFLADGPGMVRAIKRLVPLDEAHEDRLLGEFDRTCRAVIMATLAAALVQGLLAGLGFYLAGVKMVFLLTVLTMLFSLIPFVGAVSVWLPAALWLLLHEDRTGAAIFLAIYGTGIVSTVDNVIKPLVLHGQANLHPLLALLSVLGGIQAFGPIGFFVGPMVVVFLHTILKIVQMELKSADAGRAAPLPATSAASDSTAARAGAHRGHE